MGFAESSPLSVLVVDDNPDLALSTAMLLDLYGYAARVALSGADALAATAVDPPDVAIVDLLMPGMDGIELTRRLREGSAGRPPFVIIMSGCGSLAHRRLSAEAGADMHLLKPVDPGTLTDILGGVRDGLGRAGAAGARG